MCPFSFSCTNKLHQLPEVGVPCQPVWVLGQSWADPSCRSRARKCQAEAECHPGCPSPRRSEESSLGMSTGTWRKREGHSEPPPISSCLFLSGTLKTLTRCNYIYQWQLKNLILLLWTIVNRERKKSCFCAIEWHWRPREMTGVEGVFHATCARSALLSRSLNA